MVIERLCKFRRLVLLRSDSSRFRAMHVIRRGLYAEPPVLGESDRWRLGQEISFCMKKKPSKQVVEVWLDAFASTVSSRPGLSTYREEEEKITNDPFSFAYLVVSTAHQGKRSE
jgi:hypothetical protein